MNCNLHAKINIFLPKLLQVEVFDHSSPNTTRAGLSLMWWRKKSELRNGKWFTEGTPAPCWTHSSSTHTFSTSHFSGTLEYCLLASYWVPWVSRRLRFPFGSLCWDEKIFRRNSKEHLVRKEKECSGPRPRHHTQAVDRSAFREGFFSVWRAEDHDYMFVCSIYAHVCAREWRQVALSLVYPFSSGRVPSDFPLGWWEEWNTINRPQGFRTQLDHIRVLSWSWSGGTWVFLEKLFKMSS